MPISMWSPQDVWWHHGSFYCLNLKAPCLCVFHKFAQYNKVEIKRTCRLPTKIRSLCEFAWELDSFKKLTGHIFHREAKIGMHSSLPKSSSSPEHLFPSSTKFIFFSFFLLNRNFFSIIRFWIAKSHPSLRRFLDL